MTRTTLLHGLAGWVIGVIVCLLFADAAVWVKFSLCFVGAVMFWYFLQVMEKTRRKGQRLMAEIWNSVPMSVHNFRRELRPVARLMAQKGYLINEDGIYRRATHEEHKAMCSNCQGHTI